MADPLAPAETRLARTLLRLAALDPKPGKAGLRIDLGLSQSDLGELTFMARETRGPHGDADGSSGVAVPGGKVRKIFFSEEKAAPALREAKDFWFCAGGRMPAVLPTGSC